MIAPFIVKHCLIITDMGRKNEGFIHPEHMVYTPVDTPCMLTALHS
jgi:hypothetical protein